MIGIVHLMKNGMPDFFKKQWQGVIYTVVDNTMVCINNEPPINKKKIFMSILPSSEEEI